VHDGSEERFSVFQRTSWPFVALSTLGIALGIVLVDQATKLVILRTLGRGADASRHDLMGSLLALDFVRNTGVAFGMLQGRQWLVSILAIAVLAGFLIGFGRDLPLSRLARVGVGLIVGGAIGNLIDRIRLGYVVDFIAVGSFPRFNVADSAITIGLCCIGWFLLTEQSEHHNEAQIPDRNEVP
jgi:signal peptidase II